jgi:hypothetical protein
MLSVGPPTLPTIVVENLVFFAVACAVLAVGVLRYRGTAPFPGPVTPWPTWFQVWFRVIWIAGFLLPLGTLIYFGILPGDGMVVLALAPYFVMFFVQIASEQYVWKAHASPIWVSVPALYLPWRLWQVLRGFQVMEPYPHQTFVIYTLWVLFILWIINIGVHYSGIPASMRYPAHKTVS